MVLKKRSMCERLAPLSWPPGYVGAGVPYRLFSVWTLVPVRLGKQLSGNSTVDEIASEAADIHNALHLHNTMTYTFALHTQWRIVLKGGKTTTVGRRGSAVGACVGHLLAGKTGRKKEGEREKEKRELEKTRAGRFKKRRGESRSFLFRDADQGSKTRIRKNALRTRRRQAVERATSKRGYHSG
ncbi:hypothetical protein TNCV_76431 [Trichonephila clavipes]|nr:hypothetical protein TNCV_76431 [Trichonephila clavipes]